MSGALSSAVASLAPIVVARIAEARGRDRWYPITYSDLGAAYDSAHTQLAVQFDDSTLAAGLALFIRGSLGTATDQAAAAAELFSAWQLPIEPAVTALTDYRLPSANRLAALHALKAHWTGPALTDPLTVVFCDLAERADLYARRGVTQQRPPEYLPTDDRNLLLLVIVAYDARQPSLLTLLNPASPLRAYLATNALGSPPN